MNVSTFVYILKGQYNQAIDQGKRAIGEMPNIADAHAFLAYAFLYSEQPHEAVVEIMKAMRLAPYYPVHYLSCLGQAYFLAGRYEEAETAFAKRLERDPGNANCLVWLAVISAAMRNYKKANTAAGEVLKIEPNFSLAKWCIRLYYKNAATNDRIMAYARKAGLPDRY
jgi:tetratricopeptide (TPR) repeat protein